MATSESDLLADRLTRLKRLVEKLEAESSMSANLKDTFRKLHDEIAGMKPPKDASDRRTGRIDRRRVRLERRRRRR